jgi:RimJ/RimL family protein N-acetyltransferase
MFELGALARKFNVDNASNDASSSAPGARGITAPSQLIVPIRSLSSNHRERIYKHLLSLDAINRYFRFGYIAPDDQIRDYVDALNFERDEVFGIYNRKLELLAVAHLAYSPNPKNKKMAEFGASVVATARRRGYGARLYERAAMHASNDGIEQLYIHALSENVAMLKIAQNAGATLERDGPESDAYLRLPAPTLSSRITEMVEEQFAQTDYRIKRQAKQFKTYVERITQLGFGAFMHENKPDESAVD